MFLKFKVKRKRFSKAQRDFLLQAYDRDGSTLNEKQAHLLMKTVFNVRNGNYDELLSEAQIKAWFSAETLRRKRKSSSNHVQRTEEAMAGSACTAKRTVASLSSDFEQDHAAVKRAKTRISTPRLCKSCGEPRKGHQRESCKKI